jgi:hypothetical protein
MEFKRQDARNLDAAYDMQASRTARIVRQESKPIVKQHAAPQ